MKFKPQHVGKVHDNDFDKYMVELELIRNSLFLQKKNMINKL